MSEWCDLVEQCRREFDDEEETMLEHWNRLDSERKEALAAWKADQVKMQREIDDREFGLSYNPAQEPEASPEQEQANSDPGVHKEVVSSMQVDGWLILAVVVIGVFLICVLTATRVIQP
jgi:peptidoglycan hydrolase CwlO-like protein